MNGSTHAELVDAALTGAPDAVEKLHVLCANPAAAKEVTELLFAAWSRHAKPVEDWLQAVVEMHPDLAAPIGSRLRAKLGLY